MRQALHQLEQLPVDVPALTDTIQMLNEAQIQISEAGDNLRRFVDDYEADPVRLNEVEERLSAIYQMARKHRITPEELPELHQRLSQELAELDGGEARAPLAGQDPAHGRHQGTYGLDLPRHGQGGQR